MSYTYVPLSQVPYSVGIFFCLLWLQKEVTAEEIRDHWQILVLQFMHSRTIWGSDVTGGILIAGRLDQMTFKGPFQPKLFYDSMILSWPLGQ